MGYQWVIRCLSKGYQRVISALWESFNGRCNICISLRIFNFASHFFCVQIFQIDLSALLLILSVSKYSRYICGGRNEQLSVMLSFKKNMEGESELTNRIFGHPAASKKRGEIFVKHFFQTLDAIFSY